MLVPANASPYVTIVGVAGNTRNDDLRSESQPAVLLPYTLLAPPGRTLAIRAQGDPMALVGGDQAHLQSVGSPLAGLAGDSPKAIPAGNSADWSVSSA